MKIFLKNSMLALIVVATYSVSALADSSAGHGGQDHPRLAPTTRPDEIKLSKPFINEKSRILTFDAKKIIEFSKGKIQEPIMDAQVREAALNWAKDRCEYYSQPELVALLQQKEILQMYLLSSKPEHFQKDRRLPGKMRNLKFLTFPGNIAAMSFYNQHHSIDCKSVGFESFYGIVGPKTTKDAIWNARENGNPLVDDIIMIDWYHSLDKGTYKGISKVRTTCEPRPDYERRALQAIVNCYEEAKDLSKNTDKLEKCSKAVEAARAIRPKILPTEYLKAEEKNICQKIEI